MAEEGLSSGSCPIDEESGWKSGWPSSDLFWAPLDPVAGQDTHVWWTPEDMLASDPDPQKPKPMKIGSLGLLYGMGQAKVHSMAQAYMLQGMQSGKAMIALEQFHKEAKTLLELKHFALDSIPFEGPLDGILSKYATMVSIKVKSEPPSPKKPWEAKLPQERPPQVKGFRKDLTPADPKKRAKAKAARKARRKA